MTNKIDRIKELVEQLNYHRNLYYNESRPEISDFEYDQLFDELSTLEEETGFILPASPTQTVGYEVKSSLSKVEHNHPMLSLDKTKDWNDFIQYFSNKDVIGMLKMDGLTCSLCYINGALVSAETRGDGAVGEDILHNAKVVKSIPKKIPYKGKLIIDGEIICTYKDFEPFSDEYKNPRNFASGSVRLLDSNECAKRALTFVVWNVIKGFDETNSFLSKLELIEKQGFIVVPWTSSFDWDAKEFLVDQAKKLGYPIDGLVGRFDDIKYGESLGTTSHHSNAAYAYKFGDDTYETILRDVEWTMGKTGVLTPTAVFDSVEVDGTDISRASLSNVSVMYDTLGIPYIGQKIYISKRNMIIPKIERADNKYKHETFDSMGFPEKKFLNPPLACPICGEPTTIKCNDDVKILICTNPDCSGKLLGRFTHFVSKKAMNIDGLSEATLDLLISNSYINNFEDIYHLYAHKNELVRLPGLGTKSVEKLLQSIEKSREVKLENFLVALCIDNIGTSASKTISKACGGDLNKLIMMWANDFEFKNLKDFGEVTAKSFTDYFDEYINEIEALACHMKFVVPEVKTENNVDLGGKTICITGALNIYKNRDELMKDIENHGGKVVGSVSKKTDMLLTNDSSSGSTKARKAAELGIPIVSEVEFRKMIGVE